MEKTDWSDFFMEVFNLLFEEKTAEAIQVIEKQRLVMGLPNLDESEIEIVWRYGGIMKMLCMKVAGDILLEEQYSECEKEINLLNAKLKHWKYNFLLFSRKKIKAQRKEWQMRFMQIQEEICTPQAPYEWQEARYAYEKLASLFGFNEEWVDKIANISQIVDSFQARLIK
jgi:folylpolyglutamate synthase/dihydropteroate synthase